MKEVRLHGRGGQGLVKGAQIIVKAAVSAGKYATFIPFFGVERKGSPVYGFLRIDDKPIRPKNMVYSPDCVIVLDDTLFEEIDVYEGIRDDSMAVINSMHSIEQLPIPEKAGKIGVVNATDISIQHLGRNIPNTTVLGAFCRTTGWLPLDVIADAVQEEFNEANARACADGYKKTMVVARGQSDDK
jgi:2-oxoacid:acceptor oxidoreductase gamma subunit (pyruvate/2-ketoisovalerate family)